MTTRRWTRSVLAAAAAVVTTVAVTVAGPGAAGAAEPDGARPSGATVEAALLTELERSDRTSFWVVLDEPADLARAAAVTGWADRGEAVYEQLTSTATRSQADLRRFLSARDVPFRPFWIVNAIQVTGDRALVHELARQPGVTSLLADRTHQVPEPAPAGAAPAAVAGVEWGVDRIGAAGVWQDLGVRGEGIVVGVIDTGAAYTHQALVQQYRGNLGGGEFDHNYHWHDPSGVCGSPSRQPCDNVGHGTHVTGTIAGGGAGADQIGVAPGAQWIAAKGCETLSCSTAALLSAGQFMLAPTDLAGEHPRPDLRPHIVNNSWGGGADANPWYQGILRAWLAAGIFPQFANGNTDSGTAPCGSAGNPGNMPDSYAAGAFDVDNQIAPFSNRGPSAWGGELIKPNIAAPGVAIRSASSAAPDAYLTASGTSMASPHVAGTVALMWSAAPDLVRDTDRTRWLLDLTAVDTSDLTCGGTAGNNNVWGQGRLDARAAVDAAGDPPPAGTLSGTVVDTASGETVADALITVTGAVSRSTLTGADGGYAVTMPAGTYEVSVVAAGYPAEPPAPATVTADRTATVHFALTPLGEWEARYDGPGAAADAAEAVAVSPDGGRLFVTGASTGDGTGEDYATVAYDPASGEQLWAARYDGGGGDDQATSLAVSGDRVFVTGRSPGAGPGFDYATVAYHAASGEQLWVARHDGPASDPRPSLAPRTKTPTVTADGDRVFVTGFDHSEQTGADYGTVAYDAATGDRLWAARYAGSEVPEANDTGYDVTVAAGAVYVTGTSRGAEGRDHWEYATVAYDAATGEQRWVARYSSTNRSHAAWAVTATASQVFVTGQSSQAGAIEYATVAYDAATGDRQWESRHRGPRGSGIARDVVVIEDGTAGDRVFVTGSSLTSLGNSDAATISYDAATGEELWQARYDGPRSAGDTGRALAVVEGEPGSGLAGATVVVTGEGWGYGAHLDYFTAAYDAATGARQWDARHARPAAGRAEATGIAVAGSAPDYRVFVTGLLRPDASSARTSDFATVSYRVREPVCDRTITGPRLGAVVVASGVTCLDGARVLGPVAVRPGAALVSTDSVVLGGVSAVGASRVELERTQVIGGLLVRRTTGAVSLFSNTVHGPVRLRDSATEPVPVIVAANTVRGMLYCSGNAPRPTDLGLPNQVTGSERGQCG